MWLWGQPLTKDIFISLSETFFLDEPDFGTQQRFEEQINQVIFKNNLI
jgi:hypothetical protein